MNLRFKDFEIRPTSYLDGKERKNDYEVVKWYAPDDSIEVTDIKTGEKKMQTRFCYTIANFQWNEKQGDWMFKSCGTRFLEDCKPGLCDFILRVMDVFEVVIRNE